MADFFVANLTANRATTFWILSRLLGSMGFMISSFIPEYKRSELNKWVFIIPTSILVISLLIVVTYIPDFIPAMYVENYGLTETKIILEYLVVIIMIIAFLKIYREYKRNNKRLDYLIMIALLLSIFRVCFIIMEAYMTHITIFLYIQSNSIFFPIQGYLC